MPKPNFTRSYFQASDVQIRRNDAGKVATIVGYAAVFEGLSLPMYGFKEKIRAGAFKNSIKSNNVRALWNHNSDFVLGSTKAKTLRLSEDTKGLRFELDPPETQAGNDAVVSIERGDVDGMSFGFNVLSSEWDEKDPDNVIRTLIDVDLFEISPTPFPAYEQTTVDVRSIADDYNDYRGQDQALEEKRATERSASLIKTEKERLYLLERGL